MNRNDFLRSIGLAADDPVAGAPHRPIPEVQRNAVIGKPMRLPGRILRSLLQNAIPVREINRYPTLITLNFSITVAGGAGSIEAIQSPPFLRDFLSIRSSTASAGQLFVSFNVNPAVDGTAAFALPAGSMLLFDTVIPQDDVWLGTDVATTLAVVAYANAGYT